MAADLLVAAMVVMHGLMQKRTWCGHGCNDACDCRAERSCNFTFNCTLVDTI
jgi:hypothetical protein